MKTAEMNIVKCSAFWILVFALLLLTRIPAAAQYLSVDNVNLAFALQDFDPRIHQPQPPGYPFFVGFARLMNIFFRDAGKTFLAISVLVSALCLPLTAALGKRMFDRWVGQSAALLLLIDPVFWHSGLDGPLRPNLALFALLTAYCAWRAWNGDKSFVILGACALGVGSGFRPDLLVFLAPLWLFSAWVGTRSVKSIALGCAVLCALILVWVGALAYAVGGISGLTHLTAQYLVDQSQGESVVFGASIGAWFRQVNRLIIWNGLAIIGWLWAVPLLVFSSRRLSVLSPQSAFMIVWLAPGLLAQGLIHVAAPGHTLFSIPAWCLMGAYVLWAGAERWQIANVAVTVALVVNTMLFLNYVPLPPAEAASSGSLWQSAKNAAIFGTFETSIGAVRYADDAIRVSLREIHEFSKTADRPTIVVCEDVVPKQDWFMVWPIARYYLPEQEIRVVASQADSGAAKLVRRDRISSIRTGAPVIIRIPKPVRILWLMEHGGRLHRALEKTVSLQAGQQVFYTDVNAGADSFQAPGLLFRPAGIPELLENAIQ